MEERGREPGTLYPADRRRPELFAHRDRDWQAVVVLVSLVGMFVFEMFHSPPCHLGWTSCSGTQFAAKIMANAIWAALTGISTGIALAAIMRLIVDAIDTRRSKGTNVPLLRIALGTAAVVLLFVIVLVRFEFLSS